MESKWFYKFIVFSDIHQKLLLIHDSTGWSLPSYQPEINHVAVTDHITLTFILRTRKYRINEIINTFIKSSTNKIPKLGSSALGILGTKNNRGINKTNHFSPTLFTPLFFNIVNKYNVKVSKKVTWNFLYN
jgi:hypothetical protein